MKWIFLSLGSMTVFSGLILLVLPIPLGIPLLIIGVPVLMRYSSRMRRWILHMASRFPKIHDILSQIPVAPEYRQPDQEKTPDD